VRACPCVQGPGTIVGLFLFIDAVLSSEFHHSLHIFRLSIIKEGSVGHDESAAFSTNSKTSGSFKSDSNLANFFATALLPLKMVYEQIYTQKTDSNFSLFFYPHLQGRIVCQRKVGVYHLGIGHAGFRIFYVEPGCPRCNPQSFGHPGNALAELNQNAKAIYRIILVPLLDNQIVIFSPFLG